jgi:hypothetical protein
MKIFRVLHATKRAVRGGAGSVWRHATSHEVIGQQRDMGIQFARELALRRTGSKGAQ